MPTTPHHEDERGWTPLDCAEEAGETEATSKSRSQQFRLVALLVAPIIITHEPKGTVECSLGLRNFSFRPEIQFAK